MGDRFLHSVLMFFCMLFEVMVWVLIGIMAVCCVGSVFRGGTVSDWVLWFFGC